MSATTLPFRSPAAPAPAAAAPAPAEERDPCHVLLRPPRMPVPTTLRRPGQPVTAEDLMDDVIRDSHLVTRLRHAMHPSQPRTEARAPEPQGGRREVRRCDSCGFRLGVIFADAGVVPQQIPCQQAPRPRQRRCAGRMNVEGAGSTPLSPPAPLVCWARPTREELSVLRLRAPETYEYARRGGLILKALDDAAASGAVVTERDGR